MRSIAAILGLVCVTASSAADQSAAAPRFSVGDSWTRSNGVTVTVVKVDGSSATIKGFFSAYPTALVTLDGDFQPVAITDEQGKALDPVATRGLPLGKEWKLFDWPLENGKSWTSSGQLVSRTGAKVLLSIDRRVTAVEEVQTIAGGFTAYRIEETWKASYYPSGGWINMIWYSPTAKTIVKFQSNDTNQKAWEVVSYSLR